MDGRLTAAAHTTGALAMSDLQFSIGRDAFAEAINWVARVIPNRPPLPIMGGIQLEATDSGQLRIAAYDLEVSATVTVRADIEASGEVLVSGRLLQAICRALPKKPVQWRTETMVRINCGAAEFTLPTMDHREFPELPPMPGADALIDAEVFTEAIGQTVVAVHRGDGNEFLKGVCLEVASEGELTLAATDRYRIATRTIPWTFTAEWAENVGDPASAIAAGAGPLRAGQKLIVPTRFLSEIGRMGGDEIAVGFDGNLLGIESGARRTTTRLLDGEFPKYQELFPTEFATHVTVVTADLVEALQRALALDQRDYPRVKLNIEAGVIHMEGGEGGVGGIREDVAAEVDGDPIALWVNPRYLLDGLAGVRDDKALIGLNAPQKPITVVPQDGGGYRYLLMPTIGDVSAP